MVSRQSRYASFVRNLPRSCPWRRCPLTSFRSLWTQRTRSLPTSLRESRVRRPRPVPAPGGGSGTRAPDQTSDPRARPRGGRHEAGRDRRDRGSTGSGSAASVRARNLLGSYGGTLAPTSASSGPAGPGSRRSRIPRSRVRSRVPLALPGRRRSRDEPGGTGSRLAAHRWPPAPPRCARTGHPVPGPPPCRVLACRL